MRVSYTIVSTIILGFVIQFGLSFIPQKGRDCGIPVNLETGKLGPVECRSFVIESRFGSPAWYTLEYRPTTDLIPPWKFHGPQFILNIVLWHGVSLMSIWLIARAKQESKSSPML